MEIQYTNHAEEQIKERHISKDTVRAVLLKPEREDDSRLGTKIAQKAMNGKLVRVVYKTEGTKYIIITV